jgi:1-acyl-sn-glycerol-3-phosphate acyltransferase
MGVLSVVEDNKVAEAAALGDACGCRLIHCADEAFRMKWLSGNALRLMGWTIIGSLPDSQRMLVVGFPHTSNWDFFVFLAVMHHFKLRGRFLAKRGLFKGPFGWLMKRWGGIPVDSAGGAALIDTAIASFEQNDSMVLVIAPEGTRGATDAWKSGFWRIADAADVLVMMAFVDGATRSAGFGPAFRIDGDPEAWMRKAAVFYEDKRGLKPKNRGGVTL